jgi:hypothetical protein
MWFRRDLRVADNPALLAAAAAGSVIPVYILDDINAGDWAMGGASRWWLHHSLTALNASLDGKLLVLTGDALTLIPALARQLNATQVCWNRCYEPWRVQRDKRIKEQLLQQGTGAHSFNGSLLWEPWQVLKDDQTPYKVFTPFFRRGCMKAAPPAPAAGGQSLIDFKNNRFFGMIIPEAHGGLGFSAAAHSAVIVKVASRSVTAAEYTAIKRDRVFRTRRIDPRNEQVSAALINAQNELAFRKRRLKDRGFDPALDGLLEQRRAQIAALRQRLAG